jgi:hypothetical protein
VWAAGYGTRSVAFGGRCAKKSLASASIQERHALSERLREQMPHLSIRKLCRSWGVNRQWYYQHRCPSAHQEYDQRLCAAIQEIREVFAGYGYHRVTKALIRAGRIGQSQAGLACDATSWFDLPPQATHGAYNRFETQLPDLPKSREGIASQGTQSLLGCGFDVCAIARRLCIPGLHSGYLFAHMYRLEPFSSHRCAIAAASSGDGIGSTSGLRRVDSSL